ncbi:MAG: tRNA (adenosine(37)-N6)-threonylcarbamoyltransferase complex dimerization subunit type 1 TsaB [Bacteroidota bacterium]
MSFILNIDTALETASVCLSQEGEVLQSAINDKQNDHAAWLHPAIHDLLNKTGKGLKDLQAVAVSIGPGSYTGLRVGLASAKGFCYALDIPLITVGTLDILAHAVQQEAADLICPLIDARRMEVYAAVYEKNLAEKTPPYACLLDKNSFMQLLSGHSILFCGNGSKKLQTVLSHPNALFSATAATPLSISRLSQKKFAEKIFADLAYSEPLYVKEFYTPARL